MMFYFFDFPRISPVSKYLRRVKHFPLVLLLIPLAIPSAFSQDVNVEGIEFAVEKLDTQWTPGERYNGLNGTLNYAHTDLYLPGNGKLPIEIVRRFVQRSDSLHSSFNAISTFGHMGLAIPTVTYSGTEGICGKRGHVGDTSTLKSPLTFRDGEVQKVFFSTADRSHFETPDGWQMECVSDRGALIYDQDFYGTLIVKRPDGIEYDMRAVSGSVVPNFRVRKITDPYGNSLTYNYSATKSRNSTIRVGFAKLDSIVANDGRVVNISYVYKIVDHSENNNRYYAPRIVAIETNSSVNPIKLKYKYPSDGTIEIIENDTAKTTIKMSAGKINSIKYPTGGTVSYAYQDRIWSAGNRYHTLKRRTTSDGLTYDITYRDNGDDTFIRRIKTPSAWMEYLYGKPKKANNFGRITNHTIDSGRLKQSRRYDYGSGNSPGELLLSTDYKFVNLSSAAVRDQLQQLVVPRKTTVSMNYSGAQKANSVFTRENKTFDRWGLPLRVEETTGGNSKKISTYVYRNNNFSRHILGKLTYMVRGGDTQSYSYNLQGDVTSHTINGITTQYTWHTNGASKGELATRKTATNRVTYFKEYKRGQAQRITNPSNYSQNRIINDNATVARETRWVEYLPAGFQGQPANKYIYDNRRRLKQIDPVRHDSANIIHKWLSNKSVDITDGNNSRYIKSERFDGFGRTIAKGTFDRDQSRWSTVKYEYDAQGRLIFESYPRNTSAAAIIFRNSLTGIHYRYDALDRLESVTKEENEGNHSVMTYTYGHVSGGDLSITEKDGRGFKTTTSYRSYGEPHYQWPIRIVQADGQTTVISRDAISGRVNNFNRGGQTTRYTYNSKKLLESITQNENGKTTFSYYPDGLLKKRTNNGRVVEFKYYPDDLIRKEIYTDNSKESVTREFQYDTYRNLEYAITTSPSGSQNNTMYFTYDEGDNVKTQTLTIDGARYEMQFDYDEISGLSEITYPNNRSYALNPNGMGYPTAIREIGGQRKTIYSLIQYNHNNTMKLMRRNGHQVKNELNSGQRPFKYRVQQYGNGQSRALGERRYQYDRSANIARIDDTVAKRYMSFTYDSRNRLINENISDGPNWSYGYLNNDNMSWAQHGNVRSNYEYNSVNKRLTGVRTGSVHRRYEYDNHGNMKTHERLLGSSSKITRQLTYNAANQLTAYGNDTNYSYDARGLRVKQDRNGSIYTLYDPNERLIYRYDSQSKVSSEYFYVKDKLVARRDEDKNTTQNDPATDQSGIKVSGMTITWPDDGWYQVQTSDGSKEICSGGRSCTVPSAGTYIVINHRTGARVPTVVSSAGSETGIRVSGRTITWPDDGWYQVQTSDGSKEICSGGRSCTVPSAGTYIVINHNKGIRTNTRVK